MDLTDTLKLKYNINTPTFTNYTYDLGIPAGIGLDPPEYKWTHRENKNGTHIGVAAAQDITCARCWHAVSTVGANVEHPLLCSRCLDNVFGIGEVRVFA